jgi:signal peptide peptidase SppA
MHSILLQILRGNWYIDQEFAHGAGFLVKSMLENKLKFEGDSSKFLPVVTSFNENSETETSSVSKNVAVISISGPLMKHDQECGPAGMDTIGAWIKELDANPNVGSIIIKFDCPGGTVSGTETLGNIIRDCKKPIISFVDEMACSGAYWLSSQCDQIIASIPRARIGSIGVMLSFMDIQPAWEKEGVVFHDIVSNLSPDKNKDFKELKAGKYDNYKLTVLDPLATDFHNVVKSKRNITDETIFKGRVVFADEALTAGLIDKIASWDETLTIAFTLAEEFEQAKSFSINTTTATTEVPINTNSTNLSLTNTKIDMNKFKRVAVIANVESFESTAEGIYLQAEALEAIEQALETAEGERTINEQLTQNALTHQQTIDQRDARIAELEQELVAVRGVAAASPAIVVSSSDPGTASDEDPLNSFCKENSNDPVACMNKLAAERPDLKISTF